MSATTAQIFTGTVTTFLTEYPGVLSTPLLPHNQMSLEQYVIYIQKGAEDHQIIEVNTLIPDVSHLLLIIAAGVAVTVKDNCLNRITTIQVEERAQVIYLLEDRGTSGNNCHTTLTVNAAALAECTVYALLAALENHTLSIALNPQGCKSSIRLRGIYLKKGIQKLFIDAQQNHTKTEGTTDLICKGIVTHQAQVQYEGLIHIGVNASGTVARQESKSIVMGTQARAFAKPRLEVLNNQVVCSHGAAVGQFDAQALLYMTSRGLSVGTSQKLLLQGFLQSIFEDSSIPFLFSLLNDHLTLFMDNPL